MAIAEVMSNSAKGKNVIDEGVTEVHGGTVGSATTSHQLVVPMTEVGKDNFCGRLFMDSET